MEYLHKESLVQILNSAGVIEQLLEPRYEGGGVVVRFVRIQKDRSRGFVTALLEVFDVGSPNFLDVYEFEAVDPDLPYGDMRIFDNAGDAINFACVEIGANQERFLGNGMIQDEYKSKFHPDW